MVPKRGSSRALHHDLQIGRVPALEDDLQGFVVANLSSGDGARDAGTLSGDAVDGLRAQRSSLPLRKLLPAEAAPPFSAESLRRFRRSRAVAGAARTKFHLMRDFVIGIKHVVGAGHRISDGDHGAGLTSGLQRTEAGKGDFVARAALAVAIQGASGAAMDGGAILQDLGSFRRGGGRERSALYDLVAVKPSKPISSTRSANGPPGPRHASFRREAGRQAAGRRIVLRTYACGGQEQSAT